jgi:hypothetical protein
MKNFIICVLVIAPVMGIAVMVHFIFDASPPVVDVRKEAAQQHDIFHFVRTFISETDARAVASLEDGVVTISFNLEPWSLLNSVARWTFNDRSMQLFDNIFRNFNDAERIEITAYAAFVDIRGNEKRGKAAYATLTRRTATGIDFRNVKNENLSSIVDDYWMHPALLK